MPDSSTSDRSDGPEEGSAAVSTPPSEPPAFVRVLDAILARPLGGLLPQERRYWVLVPATGVASGLLAVAFVRLLALVQDLWGGGLPHLPEGDFTAAVESTPTPMRILLPIAGGAVVAAMMLLFGRPNRTGGTAGLIEALAVGKGRLALRRTLFTSIASVTAVGAGASLGREGALLQSGAAVASWLGRVLRLEEHHVKVLLACGAAGGVAASYNVPIAASVFAMEILLGSFALELFGPIIICSVIATAISRTFIMGNYPAYVVPMFNLQDGELILDLMAAISLGLLIGVVSAAFIRLFSGLGQALGRAPSLEPLKPVLVMAVLAGIGLYVPHLLGNGYDTVNDALRGSLPFSIGGLLGLCALKLLVTALCRAGGIPGGLFTPSLFVGALLGAAFAVAAKDLLGWEEAPVARFALLGMGAILAGTLKAPITAVLMVFELTRNYAVILPLMTACLASTLVSQLLVRSSIFTAPLHRRGVHVPLALTPLWIRQPKIESLLEPDVITVKAAEPFSAVVDRFLHSPLEHDRLYVVDDHRGYLGVISLHEIKLFLREAENLDSVIAADVLNSSFPYALVTQPVSRAIELLAESNAERLPVLEDAQTRRLLGSVSKRDLLAIYREGHVARAPKNPD